MQSHLGLNQSTTATNKDGGMRKRAAPQGAPKRSGDLWVLAQPVSASAAERNWSVYGQIMTPARSRMHHARADKLEYCHKALHLRANKADQSRVRTECCEVGFRLGLG